MPSKETASPFGRHRTLSQTTSSSRKLGHPWDFDSSLIIVKWYIVENFHNKIITTKLWILCNMASWSQSQLQSMILLLTWIAQRFCPWVRWIKACPLLSHKMLFLLPKRLPWESTDELRNEHDTTRYIREERGGLPIARKLSVMTIEIANSVGSCIVTPPSQRLHYWLLTGTMSFLTTKMAIIGWKSTQGKDKSWYLITLSSQ